MTDHFHWALLGKAAKVLLTNQPNARMNGVREMKHNVGQIHPALFDTQERAESHRMTLGLSADFWRVARVTVREVIIRSKKRTK